MEETIRKIRLLGKQSRFNVVLNKWSKFPLTVGYCQSPKSGKWGAYRRQEHSLEKMVCETEKEAAEAVLLFLMAEAWDTKNNHRTCCPTYSGEK